jgi:VWFA-related protein
MISSSSVPLWAHRVRAALQSIYTGRAVVSHSWRSRLAVIVAALTAAGLAGPAVSDQSPAPAPVPPARLDLVVSDAMGHAILGLRASDFEVIENGSPRPIANVEFHRRGGPDGSPIETDLDAQRAAGQPGTRVFAIFLDEFHITPGVNADLVRRTVADFIDEKVERRDLVAVMRPSDSATSLRFTRDRALAHGVIAAFEGRKGDYRPRTPAEEQYVGRDPGAVIAAREQIVRAGLRDLALRIGALRAQRAMIVLCSEGFPDDEPARSNPLEGLGGLIRATSRFHVVISTFDPGAPNQEATPSDERRRSMETLKWLAAETGGRAVDADRFIYGVARLAHDSEAYYALTFHPSEADGRFRELTVRTKRGGGSLLTSRGYWAMRDSDWRAVVSLPAAKVPPSRRVLRRSPAIDAWIGVLREPSGNGRVVVTWEPRPYGAATARIVGLKARSLSGATLFDGQLGPVGAASNSLQDSVRFDAPPGRVEVDITVTDGQGTVLDTDARDFDVPDLRPSSTAGPTLLPIWLVRARSVRDFQLANTNLQATPAAARRFVRSDRLLIRVPAFEPSGSGVRVTATLLNQRGVPMRSLERIDGTPREDVTGFALPLVSVMPGEYLIELQAENEHGTVTERLSFRVIG